MDRSFYYLHDCTIQYADFEKAYVESLDTTHDSDYMYKEIFHCQTYTEYGSDYERQGCHINVGDTVVDIGANIGMFARHASERKSSRIISFEPQREVFGCFVMNMTKEMEPYCIAISDENSMTDIEYNESENNTGGGSIVSPYDKSSVLHRERVITMTLDRLFEIGILDKVDFLKIDCEGAEYKVIKGISDENLLKFRCIAIEIHRLVLTEEEIDYIRIRLTKLGYKIFTMYWGGGLIMLNCWR